MNPYVSDSDFTLYNGDVLDVLRELPDESVDCVVTSPPYWGLRDYGTGTWEGGDEGCDHARPTTTYNDSFNERWGQGGGQKKQEKKSEGQYAQLCAKCGARRIDNQLGLEPTPEIYVERMTEVFREVRRVLAKHGTCFVNIADSYWSNPSKGGSGPGGKNEARWSYGRAARGDTPPSQSRLDALPYGTDDTERASSPGLDSACLDLCGECLDDFQSRHDRTERNDQPAAPSLASAETTDRGTSPADSEQAVVGGELPSARVSTSPESSEPLPVLCWRCGTRPASASLRVPLTSSPDAPAFSDMEPNTPDSGLRESGRHSQDTGASALAYLYSSIAARRLRPKDACLMPQLLALALQMDGWIVRAENIWAKKNCMPESVTDRPTKSHEQVWMLTKRPRYFFDQEAVREPAEWERWGDQTNGKYEGTASAAGWIGSRPKRELSGGRAARRYDDNEFKTTDERNTRFQGPSPAGRNIRSVWEIATQPYAEAHFATFPEELVRRCLLAGCPEQVCGECGKPRERITDVSYTKSPAHGAGSIVGSRGVTERDTTHLTSGASNKESLGGMPRVAKVVDTLGFTDCGHDAYAPGIVLDPFMGSGTTALVARKHGRRSIGIELNPDYCALAAKRLAQQSLFAEAS